MVVVNQKIFLVFSRGFVIRISQDGTIERTFRIGKYNLNLENSHDSLITQTYTQSIGVGISGNIYVLDTANKSVHILNQELTYISTWSDSNLPIGKNATDISFSPNNDYFFISHPWGFYANRFNLNSITGEKIDNNKLYPDYISDEYKGIKLDFNVIGSGSIDVNIVGNSKKIELETSIKVNNGAKISTIWNGKDSYGTNVPLGIYKINILLNKEIKKTIEIEVRKDLNLTIKEPLNKILSSRNTLDYKYSLLNPVKVNIKIHEKNSMKSRRLVETKKSKGDHGITIYPSKIGEDPIDGIYCITFTSVPAGLSVPLRLINGQTFEFTLNRTQINVSDIILSQTAFNPLGEIKNSITGKVSISEGAYITTQISDKNNNIIAEPVKEIYYTSGDHEITWNGKLTNGKIAPDGDYFFKLKINQKELAIPIIKNSLFFKADTTPPHITYTDNSKTEFFLSPASLSSVNQKDNLGHDETLKFSFDEPTTITIKVKNSTNEYIKTLFSDNYYTSNKICSVQWDCTDTENNSLDDGKYIIEIKATDTNGISSINSVTVNIDNTISASITSPVVKISTPEDFIIKGYATDPNIYKYKLSKKQGIKPETVLLQLFNKNTTGDLYTVDVTTFDKDTYNIIKLEIWDKADNYTHDSIVFYRPYPLNEYFSEFSINGSYFSKSKIPEINLNCLKNGTVTITLINNSGNTISTKQLGDIKNITDYTYNMDGITDGKYTLKINSRYNEYDYVYERIITVDNTPPALTFTDPGDKFSRQTDILLNIGVNDNNLKKSSLILKQKDTLIYTYYEGDTTFSNMGIPFYPMAIEEGAYSIIFTAEDKSGNSTTITKNISVDRTPPVITLTENSLTVYYLSPNEDSSIDIQDGINSNYALGFSIDELSEVYVDVLDPGLNTIKTLINKRNIDTEHINQIIWDGKDAQSSFVEDEKYTIIINATDQYGNDTRKDIPVFIDNNKLIEGAISRELIESPIKLITTGGKQTNIIKLGNKYLAVYLRNISGLDTVYGQYLDNNGNNIGTEIILGQEAGNSISELTIIDSETGFNLLWYNYTTGNINCKQYKQSGEKIGDTFQIDIINPSSFTVSDFKNGYIIVTGGIDTGSINNDLITMQYIYNKNFELQRSDVISREETNNYIMGSNTKNYSNIKKNESGYSITYTEILYIENYRFKSRFNIQNFDFNGNPIGNTQNLMQFTANFDFKPQIIKTSFGFDILYEHNGDIITLIIEGNTYLPETLIKTIITVGTDPVMKSTNEGFLITYKNPEKVLLCQFYHNNGEQIGSELIVSSTYINEYNVFIKDNAITYVIENEIDNNYKQYQITHIPFGNNLTASISEPGDVDISINDNLILKGSVLDANFDKFRIIQKNTNSNKEPTILFESTNNVIENELYEIDLFSLIKNNKYNITLEAWDKAGNYRSDNLYITRAFDPNDFILEYNISEKYISLINPGIITLKLIEKADINIIIYDGNGTIRKNIPISNIKDLTNYKLNTTGLEDGTYQFSIVVDYNNQFFNTSSTIIIDNTKPIMTLSNFGLLENDDNINLTANITDDNILEYSIKLMDSENRIVTLLKKGNTTGIFEDIILSPKELKDGNYSIALYAIDKSGNNSFSSTGFVIDKTAPVLTLSPDTRTRYYISPNQESSYGVQDTIGSNEIISFTFNEVTNAIINIVNSNDKIIKDVLENEYFKNTKCNIIWNGKNNNGDFVTDGIYTIRVNYKDRHENKGLKTFTIVVDNTNATSSFETLSKKDISFTDKLEIKGNISDINLKSYVVKLQKPDNSFLKLAEGITSISGLLAILDEGDIDKDYKYTIVLETIDKAGNRSSDYFSVTRPYSTEEFIIDFTIDKTYSSLLKAPNIDIQLLKKSEVSIELLNLSNNISKIISIGKVNKIEDSILDISDLEDGVYEVNLLIKYKTQNYSKTKTIIIDNTNPVIELKGHSSYYSNQENIGLSATIEEDSPARYKVSLLNSNRELLQILKEGSNRNLIYDIYLSPQSLNEDSYLIEIIVVDSAGNQSTTENPFIIDRTNPVIILNSPFKDSIINGNINIKGSVTDSNQIKTNEVFIITDDNSKKISTFDINSINYSFDSLSYTKKILYTTIRIITTDIAGNTETLERNFIIDNQPPEPFINFKTTPFNLNDTDYISSNNEILLSADSIDDISGIDQILFKINNGDWQKFTDPFTLDSEGFYIITYKACDTTGNWSTEKTANLNVDNQNPSVSVKVSAPKYINGNKTFIPLENNVIITANDNLTGISSGIKQIKYSFDTVRWEIYNGEAIEFSNEGNYTLYIKAYDNVGNSIENTITDLIVDTAPGITSLIPNVESYLSRERNIIAFKTPEIFTLSAVDLGLEPFRSGVSKTYIEIDNKLSIYENPIEINMNKEYQISYYSKDNVGNKELKNNVLIAVDQEPPSIKMNYDKEVYIQDNTIYSKPETIFSITATDNFAGVEGIYSRFNNTGFNRYTESFTFAEEIDINFEYYADDNIGCRTSIEDVIISIDNTPPETFQSTNHEIVIVNGVNYADSRYILSWKGFDKKSGIKKTYVKVNGKDVDINQFKITEDGQYNIEYYSIDNLGITENINTFKIISPIPDRTPPVTELTYTYEPLIIDMELYFKNDVELGFKAEDLIGGSDSYASGVNSIQYILDYGTKNEFNGDPITLEEGTHTISFFSTDNVGNIEVTKKHNIVIDITAPETQVDIPTSDRLTVNDVIFINNKDLISFNPSDNLSGVKSTYYRIDNETTWNKFTNGFRLEYGEHIIEYYSIDNLLNQEEIKTIELSVQNYYTFLDYKKTHDFALFKDLKKYDSNSKSIVYILQDNEQHIYLSYFKPEDKNIYKNSLQLTEKSKIRNSVTLYKNLIITTEEDRDQENIYLYNTEHEYQQGEQISFNGTNNSPLIINNSLYWINKEYQTTNILIYDFTEKNTTVIYSTDKIIPLIQNHNSVLEFIVKDNKKEEFYRIKESDVELLYTTNSGNTTSFAFNNNIMAIEQNNMISLIDINNNQTVIRTIIGNNPILRDYRMLFTNKEEENIILYEMNIGNSSIGKLAVGSNIKNISISENNILSYCIQNNPLLIDEFVHYFYEPDNKNSNYNTDYLNNTGNYNLVIKSKIIFQPLISEILSDENFIIHRSINEGDIIYSDSNYILPELIPAFNNAWYIETPFTNNYVDINFMAECDITLHLLVEQKYINKFIAAGYKDSNLVPFSSSSKNWNSVASTRKYSVLSKKYLKGDYISISSEAENITPLIFILKSCKNVFKQWESEKAYNSDETIIYKDQLYKTEYYSFNRLPIKGDPWKRLDIGSISQEWDENQVYKEGEILIYKGIMYKTKWWSHNNNPDNGDPWVCVSSEENILLWDFMQTYPAESIVSYNNKIYINQYYSKSNNPKDGLPWVLVTSETQEWNKNTVYTAGDIIIFSSKQYKAKWYNKSEEPGSNKYGPWKDYNKNE